MGKRQKGRVMMRVKSVIEKRLEASGKTNCREVLELFDTLAKRATSF